MFREMRRKRQSLSMQETLAILERSTSGVLAVAGDDGYPYAVPLSHVLKDGKLFFHSAVEGHKIDGIQRNDKVTFCVIDQDEVVPQTFSTNYRSVIVFGRARILEDDREKRAALECLAERFSPGFPREAQQEIESGWDRVCIIEVTIEHATGKIAKALVSEKS